MNTEDMIDKSQPRNIIGSIEAFRIKVLRVTFSISTIWCRFVDKLSKLRNSSAERKVFGYEDFKDAQRSAYFRYSVPTAGGSIDDQTWNDLMIEELLRKCARLSSIHGIQWLYFTLRVGGSAAIHRGRLMEWLAVGERLQPKLDKLRAASSEVATALLGQQVFHLPMWAKHIHVLPWIEGGIFVCLIYLQWWPALFSALGISFFLHGAVQINLYPHLVAWRDLQRELVLLLDVASELSGELIKDVAFELPDPLQLTFIRAIRREIAPSVLDSVPGFTEYGDLLFLHSYAKLDKASKRLAVHRLDLCSMFEYIASIEMNCNVARFRSEYSTTADVTVPVEAKFSLLDAINPLLPDGMKFSITLNVNGAIITGKNGVGKSTLLRGAGLNIVLSRAFGFCVASAAELPDLMPWSSIQNEDSLALGESLYMAEMRRANELIAASGRGNCAFFVDELFRGTNNVEAIAAATAVLEELANSNIVIASSHNIALTSILYPSFTALALRRRTDTCEGNYLELTVGVESETNGVAMMGDFSLPVRVVKRAEFIANWYLNEMLISKNSVAHFASGN